MKISKKQRQKLRSYYFNDIRHHVFDKMVKMLPHVLHGVNER